MKNWRFVGMFAVVVFCACGLVRGRRGLCSGKKISGCRASSEVYAAVREQYAGRLCYVIEKSGRLRGFALSSVLVIAGITPVNLFAKDIQSAAAKCNLRLTAEDDVPYIMSCRDELSAMMNEAGVPDFDGVFRWLLTGRAENGEFTVWYPYAGEFSRIGGNDSSRMLVKI